MAEALQQPEREARGGWAGGALAVLRDDLPGGQGGEVMLQALHGAVQARPERRGEAIGQAQAVGD